MHPIKNGGITAAISYLRECERPRVIGAMMLILLCIFVVAGAHSRRNLPKPFCLV